MPATSRRRPTAKPKSPSQLLILLFLSAVIYLISINADRLLPTQKNDPYIGEGAWVRLEVIDVGQADCLLLTSSQGETMLIDSGNRDDQKLVFSYLEQRNITKIDYVVATHPHEDHIGSMAAIVNNYPIGIFYTPNAVHNTATYDAMLSSLEKNRVDVREAYAGLKTAWQTGTLEFIAPQQNRSYHDLNNYSAVLLLQFGDTSFLLTGDAEELSETEITQSYNLPKISVLKVGHHGSSTSSSSAFLQRIKPSIALISCGKNNTYGHPHRETLAALSEIGSKIYRTDINGHIIVTSDGTTIDIATEKGD